MPWFDVNAPAGSKLKSSLFSIGLILVVLAARASTSGPAYFADGPAHLKAIANHTYIIQPPGYWLFNRIAGLFSNPEGSIAVINWIFSALGCVVFYACARRLVQSPLAELGALLYATAFFAWFSGNVHSTYASQLLFPPLLFYIVLRYQEQPRTLWVCAAAASFAVGAGFRPSDGMFMAPLLLLFAWRLPRKQQLLLVLIAGVLCAGWLIPTEIAQHLYYRDTSTGELNRVATGAILLGRLNRFTVANGLRFFLPLGLALGPASLFMFRARKQVGLWLWTWVIPGSLFFLLFFISDAPYLNCLLGGFVLLCLVGLNESRHRSLGLAILACSILINLAFYFGFRALPLRSNAYAIIEKDLGNYTFYAVRHQFFVKRLTLKS